MDEINSYRIGETITVRTVSGREGKVISRVPDGRIVLFDQKSPYFDMLAPGQSVEGRIIVISENYLIIEPIHEPEEAIIVHLPELDVDDIVEDLEKLVENLSGNAEIIPKALLRVIKLEQLIIRILKGEA